MNSRAQRRRGGAIVGMAGLALVAAGVAPAQATTYSTTLQSISSPATCPGGGISTAGNDNSVSNVNVGGISADGNLVVFESDATNLVAGDTNGVTDVFVHDNATACTTRVSVDSTGVQGNNKSGWAGISANGAKVVFGSIASNLVAGDTNGFADAFVHDLATGATSLVSIGMGGALGNGDSSQVAGGLGPDFAQGTIPMRGAISGNGNRIAFPSWASNLVPADTNATSDIFVRDLAAGTTIRVNVDSAGAEADNLGGYGSVHPAISKDGNVVTFTSWATNLVAGDTNETKDVFAHDITTPAWATTPAGLTVRVNVDSAGNQAEGGVADFGNSDGGQPSADGRFVAFHSGALNLVVPDLTTNPQSQDPYVHDRLSGATTRESVSAAGVQGLSAGLNFAYPSLSPNGNLIAFNSDAPNLVPGDTNGGTDVFLRNRTTGAIVRLSVTSTGAQASCSIPSTNCVTPLSQGVAFTKSMGKIYAAFASNATNLDPADTNTFRDVFRTVCSMGCP